MPFIAFLGCDGSGKSVVIAGVSERLAAEGYPIHRGHWRPKPFEKSTGSVSAADNPHGQPARGVAASMLKLIWLWLNWWVAWFRQLRYQSKSGYLLFDRFHADLLVDPTRYRYGGPGGIARFICAAMPQPDQVIFLDAPPEVLLARKQEVGFSALEASRAAYLKLVRGRPRFRTVDASRPLADVIEDVVSHLPHRG
ncbi:MAG: hypothetical protein EAZ71_06850 [Verrucomicrobia bacterium]|nr:MAG: hypothetical protein EAZ82_12465 [Verrucomicrobiota bacterium]TAF25855.1 MAG: hypothetical protein EAZ71_06850 [Verrucomicrobiota bacterium]